MTRASLIPTASLALLLAGCAATSAPPMSPVQRAAAHTESAIATALGQADDIDRFSTLARYNPTRCDVPAWEIRLRDHWFRVALRPARDATDDAIALLESPDIGTGAAFPVLIAPTARLEPAGNQLRYRVVEVLALLPEPDTAR
ncbi:MAG: hypothetical protein EA398_07830 [Deltaproteobacteria bacterium]|nr:MAG: hypothetical protein EA398_07830 [Deltaproteobacteria bacterium]